MLTCESDNNDIQDDDDDDDDKKKAYYYYYADKKIKIKIFLETSLKTRHFN